MQKINISKLIYQFMLLVCILLTSLSHRIGHADILDDTNTVLNWAENFYPDIFPSHQETQSSEPWLYRYYPETGIYVGTNTSDSSVYALGEPWSVLNPTYIDSLSSLLNVAQSGESSTSKLSTITLPGFPHQIDIYSTVGATRAIVLLHGGSGTKEDSAYAAGLIGSPDVPSDSSVNWTWLVANKVIVVAPQGQSVSRDAATWENYVMTSGQDDVAFLTTLANYIRTQFGVSHVHLAGHSMGSVMTNRMWCEAPMAFDSYAALSGSPSEHFLNKETPCMPSAKKPLLIIYGAQDHNLTVLGVGTAWENSTWSFWLPWLTLSPALVDPVTIGGFQDYVTRTQYYCGDTATTNEFTLNDTIQNWSHCDDQFRLQLHQDQKHGLGMPNVANPTAMLDNIFQFIDTFAPP